ncbi:HVA22-like protein h [Cucumispora dikerogammari]|nr:HVA22-like protein h [Cucumispora dikerogammari]
MYIANFLTNIFILFIVLSASFKYSNDVETNRPRYTSFFLLISALLVIDRTLSFITIYIPMFYVLRVIFIVYLRSNNFAGALNFYTNILQPFLKANSECFLKSQHTVIEKIEQVYKLITEKINNSPQSKIITESVEKIKKASMGQLKDQTKRESVSVNEVISGIKGGVSNKNE